MECDEAHQAPFRAAGCSTNLAACYGAIAHLDENIGRLLQALRESGQEERTLVVFISDNGATGPEVKAAGADGEIPGEDWPKRNAAGLRGHKATVWENGIRTPLLIRWPGRIAPGERRQYGLVEDVLPTVLDLAGLPADAVPHQPFTGVSLKRALDDASVTFDRPAAFRMAIAGPGSPRANATARRYQDLHLVLRESRFKYHALPGGGQALYDLEADPGERADVQAMFPEVTARLAGQCRARWDEIMAGGRAFAPPLTPGAGGKAREE